MEENIGFAIRGGESITILNGVKNPRVVYSHVTGNHSNHIEVMTYSKNGKYLAFCNSVNIYLIDTETGEELVCEPFHRTRKIFFSPKDTYFVCWQPWCIFGRSKFPNGELRTPEPNIHFFSVNERRHLQTIIGKRPTDIPQWTQDEKYMMHVAESEVSAYEDGNLNESKFSAVLPGLSHISVSPHQIEHLFTAIISSGNNTKSVELRRIDKDMTLVSAFSMGRVDRLQIKWNSQGTVMLALVSIDVDNDGFYLISFLHILHSNGENGSFPFDKPGPVYDFKWSPTGEHFVVSYGYQPAKTTVFDTYGNVFWDHRLRYRNRNYFNPQGNLLMNCAFAPLRNVGKIQIWNFDEKTEINNILVDNLTCIEFSPNGQYFFTATTAPDICIGNCYRIWKFTGEMLYEYVPTDRFTLVEIQWKPMPEAGNQKFHIPLLTKEDKEKTGLPKKVPALRASDSTHVQEPSDEPFDPYKYFNNDEIERIQRDLYDYLNFGQLQSRQGNGGYLQPQQRKWN